MEEEESPGEGWCGDSSVCLDEVGSGKDKCDQSWSRGGCREKGGIQLALSLLLYCIKVLHTQGPWMVAGGRGCRRTRQNPKALRRMPAPQAFSLKALTSHDFGSQRQ